MAVETNNPKRWAKLLAAVRLLWRVRVAWPVRKFREENACRRGRHDWEDTPHVKGDGTVDTSIPGTFQRCRRPGCRIYRDVPRLLVVKDQHGNPVRFEVSDLFGVFSRATCPKCQGRGYSQKMALPSPKGIRATALLPCPCLVVQPRFLRTEKVGKNTAAKAAQC